MAPDSRRHERHATSNSPPLPWPFHRLRSPWSPARLTLAAVALGTLTGATLGGLILWTVGIGGSVARLLVSLGAAVVVGGLVGGVMVRWKRKPASVASVDPVASAHDAEESPHGQQTVAVVLNRRAFFERASELAETSAGEHCVAVIDVNRPNVLSEDPGEITEDPTSDAFGQMVVAAIGADAIVGRLATGGFGLVLPGTGPEHGRRVCERVRHFQPKGMETLTPSFGLTNWLCGAEGIDQALGRSEAALYRAKQRGGQRIEVIRRDDDTAGLTSDLAPVSRR